MPQLKHISCTVQWADTGAPSQEYGTQYGDGVVETFIVLPSKPQAFNIHLISHEFIYEGLAAVVFMDGNYHVNRNRVNLRPNAKNKDQGPHRYSIDFLFRQKEKSQGESLYMGRKWRFDTHNIVPDTLTEASENHFADLGTIEVLILRCSAKTRQESDDDGSSSGEDDDILGDEEESTDGSDTIGHSTEPAGGVKVSSQEDATNDIVSAFGGLFDGANDSGAPFNAHQGSNSGGHWVWHQRQAPSPIENNGFPASAKRVHWDYGPHGTRCYEHQDLPRSQRSTSKERARPTSSPSAPHQQFSAGFPHDAQPIPFGSGPLGEGFRTHYQVPNIPPPIAMPSLPQRPPHFQTDAFDHPEVASDISGHGPHPAYAWPPSYYPGHPGNYYVQPAPFPPWSSYVYDPRANSPRVPHGSMANSKNDAENPKQPDDPDTNNAFWGNTGNSTGDTAQASWDNSGTTGDAVNKNGNTSSDQEDKHDSNVSNNSWGNDATADNKPFGDSNDWDSTGNNNKHTGTWNAQASWDKDKSTGNETAGNAIDWSAPSNHNDNRQEGWSQKDDSSASHQNNRTVHALMNTIEQSTSLRDLYGPHGPYYTAVPSSEDSPRPDAEEEPRFDVPKALADARGSTMQVQPGAGYKYFKKRCCPLYMDTLGQPYARFVFQYRTKDQLKAELGIDVGVEPSSNQDIQELQNLDKQALIEMLIRAKSALGGKVPSPIVTPAVPATSEEKGQDRRRLPPDTSYLRYNMPPLRVVNGNTTKSGSLHSANTAHQNKTWGNDNWNKENNRGNWDGPKANDRVEHSQQPVNTSADTGNATTMFQPGDPSNWAKELFSKAADIPRPPTPPAQQTRTLSPPLQQEPWNDVPATSGNTGGDTDHSDGNWGGASQGPKQPRGGW